MWYYYSSPPVAFFHCLARGETDPCSMEEGPRESNGEEELAGAAAMQEAESSVDSGVDEKVCNTPCVCTFGRLDNQQQSSLSAADFVTRSNMLQRFLAYRYLILVTVCSKNIL